MRVFASFLLAGLLGLASLTVAQAQKPALAPAHTLLWEISGPGLARPSYVFGTIHLQCAAEVKLTPALQRALAATQQLTLELDLDDPALPRQMQAHMLLPGNQQLSDCLTPAQYDTVNTYFTTQLQLSIKQFANLKPLLLMTLLLTKQLNCPVSAYETVLTDWAKANQRDVTGLETVEEQMAVLDNIPCATQAHLLAGMAAHPDQSAQEMRQLLASYQQQDPEALYRLTRDSKYGLQEYEVQLLTDRNKRWAPAIAKQAAARPTFFAVGAAHLGGPSGVLALLRQQGYQVKPVL